MNKISFELKNPHSKTSAILLRLSCTDGRLKYYTGESVEVSKWHTKAHTTDDRGIRARLDRMRAAVEGLNLDLKLKDHSLTMAAVREVLDSVTRQKRQNNLFDKMDELINQMRAGKLLTPGKKKYSKGTIKTLDFTVNLLRRFKPNMNIVTIGTYHEFIAFCHGKKFSTNYIAGQIKNWKRLGFEATGNPIYRDKQFRQVYEEVYDIYLNEDELKKMYDKELTDREDLTRDWFIIDCYTGLRISDLKLLDARNLSNGYITIANEKTDEKVVLPVHPYVAKIIQKHGGFPRTITDQEINRTIKKVAEKAGITQDVLFTITKGGVRKDCYLKKFQMVSNHTSRRSFITNLLKRGVSETLVMKMAGMKSHLTLRKYNKMSSEEAAEVMKDHPFFK